MTELLRLIVVMSTIYSISASCSSLNYCNGHGKCVNDNKCQCDDGWGSELDVTLYKAPDCSAMVCPSGPIWAGFAQSESDMDRKVEECSGQGICDRQTGLCRCKDNFTGNACQRLKCPNNCSGHGRCKSMRRLANMPDALPLSAKSFYGGLDSSTWDADVIYGCICDSSWSVGLGSGQVQEPEWFGPDCSMRHCPSGDNPRTRKNESDCFNVKTRFSHEVGQVGNLCQVDCSNLGVCDHQTGVCHCFKGFFGPNCRMYEGYYFNDTKNEKIIPKDEVTDDYYEL